MYQWFFVRLLLNSARNHETQFHTWHKVSWADCIAYKSQHKALYPKGWWETSTPQRDLWTSRRHLVIEQCPLPPPNSKASKNVTLQSLLNILPLGRQFQGQGNPHSIGTHEYRCKIKLKPCFGTIYLASACFCGRMLQDSSPVLVRVVSLYLDSRTQQAAPLFLLVQQKAKEYVGENEKVRADLTFTCSQNSDKLGSPLKALTNTSGKMRTHQLFHKMQREAKARAVFISLHLYPPAGH